MRITILASGSKGNATIFESGGTRLLVDAGVGLRAVSAVVPKVDGILVTHAHGDHVGHCERLSRKLKAPLYMSEATHRAVDPAGACVVFGAREPFSLGALSIAPIPLPHDAAQVGLVVADGSSRVALATDLGEVPPGLVKHFRGCDVLLLESNHDVDMLENGPYPVHLQRRIMSARGHLSNAQTRGFLRALVRDAEPGGFAHTVVLMHLSETNNHPKLAAEAAADALEGSKARLLCASQRQPVVIDTARPAELPGPRQLSLPL